MCICAGVRASGCGTIIWGKRLASPLQSRVGLVELVPALAAAIEAWQQLVSRANFLRPRATGGAIQVLSKSGANQFDSSPASSKR